VSSARAIFLLTMRSSRLIVAVVWLATAACPSPDTTKKAMDALIAANAPPDELPVMRNRELPFKYPDALFASKVQANVTLRIYIDSVGMVWPESTQVVQTSGYPALDSAAVRGAPQLQFLPARREGKPVAVSIKLPVLFRHPGASPVPGDTILRPKATAPATP
jgi:TonB family protein